MPVSVLVVDDSPLCRGILSELLQADGDIVVVGEAGDGYAAFTMAESLKPDLITMDIDMPGVDGLETIERIMAQCPVPILVITGEPVGPGSDLVFNAVERGALDLLPKPSISNKVEGTHLRNRVRALASVPVFLHVATLEAETERPPSEVMRAAEPTFKVSRPAHPATRIIAIAAGAGGPRAVASVLRGLPAELPCPVAVAQHIPLGFANGYAEFLRSQTSLRVVMVTERPAPYTPGTIFVAPDGAHLVCKREGLVAVREPSPNGPCPSASMLLQSASEVHGESAVGVILSGLGDDGITGAAAMRDAGGLMIAEDERARPAEMPRAAIDAGVIDRIMPVQLIADMLIAGACIPQERQTSPPPA